MGGGHLVPKSFVIGVPGGGTAANIGVPDGGTAANIEVPDGGTATNRNGAAAE
ncbi:hypothetical protein [Corynebacterium sp. HMSC28B08]|uniref:hypothetical protein n=1 Tax=Corynebacterium sp. HMSC28B08 TaxID=1581066 RepID=UPI00143C20FD|nr:hypothetical protein [Corynebacterium sp. HMSC28B08]